MPLLLLTLNVSFTHHVWMLVLYVLHLVDVDLDVYRWIHHTIPFIWLLGDIDQSIWMKSGIIFTCIFRFCSLSQQMFCVCCTTLMSCFQIITHWSHGQLKSLNISKYDCMYLRECLTWVVFSTVIENVSECYASCSQTLHLTFLLWWLFFFLCFGFDPPPLRYL